MDVEKSICGLELRTYSLCIGRQGRDLVRVFYWVITVELQVITQSYLFGMHECNVFESVQKTIWT